MNIQVFFVLVLFCAVVGFTLATNKGDAWALVVYSVAALTAMQVTYIVTALIQFWRT